MLRTEAATPPAAVPPPEPRISFRWLRSLLYGSLAGFLVVVALEVVRATLGRNFHTVIPDRVYRSAQPSGADLKELIHERGIRTVVNLRGNCAPLEWYLDECRVTHDLNVAQEDIGMSAGRLPSTHEVRRLVEILDHSDYPILFHCYRGADRTGLASTVAQLLCTDATLNEALAQMGVRFGHLPVSRPAHLDRFFTLYADWLAEWELEHSPAVFRRWIEHDYCPGECRCTLRLLEPPAFVVTGKPFVLVVRARNTSIKAWRLRPGTNAGIHASFSLADHEGHGVAMGRAGLFDADVRPGESIDLQLAFSAVPKPGRYSLMVDMVDEQHCSFYQTGSELLEWELEVREQEAAAGS